MDVPHTKPTSTERTTGGQSNRRLYLISPQGITHKINFTAPNPNQLFCGRVAKPDWMLVDQIVNPCKLCGFDMAIYLLNVNTNRLHKPAPKGYSPNQPACTITPLLECDRVRTTEGYKLCKKCFTG